MSNVREVQSLARETNRETGTVETSEDDLAKLAQDLESRLESASAELQNAKSLSERLFASTFLTRSPEVTPAGDGRKGPLSDRRSHVPGSLSSGYSSAVDTPGSLPVQATEEL
jgi:hypothetical protein